MSRALTKPWTPSMCTSKHTTVGHLWGTTSIPSLKVSDFLVYNNKNTYMLISVHRRSILMTTRSICPDLIPESEEVAAMFEQALKLFAHCHHIYDSCRVLKDREIDRLGE